MSPLFSTIILIAFAIALGGVVMSWGKAGYTPAKPVECKQTSLTLIDYGENKGICYKDNVLFFTIQNNGEIELDGLGISVLGEGIDSSEIDRKINVGEIVKLEHSYSGIGKIEKVIFIPKFNNAGQQRLCPKSGFSIDKIGEC